MFWIIPISFVIAVPVWILLGPVIIYADTRKKRFYLLLPVVFRAELVPGDEIFSVRGRIFFFPYRFNPLKPGRTKDAAGKGVKKVTGGRRKKVTEGGRKGTAGKKRNWMASLNWKSRIRFGRELIGSFRIRHLELDIDTDDFLLNSCLVPAFTGLNGDHINMRVNFEGAASLLLHVRTRLGRLLWIFFKYNLKSKFNN